jgi:hypothetical protein
MEWSPLVVPGQVRDYIRLGVERDKLVLGVPWYGYR